MFTLEHMTIKNLTPHDVTICDPNSNEIIKTFTPSGTIARVSQKVNDICTVGKIPLTYNTYGEVTGLPESRPNTYYIVSALVANAEPSRNDLLVPNESIRDDTGRIIGCKSLAFPTGPANLILATYGELSVGMLIESLKTFNPSDQVYFQNYDFDPEDGPFFYRLESIDIEPEHSIVFKLD